MKNATEHWIPFWTALAEAAKSCTDFFEVREGMEEVHTPETDLIRRHQDFEEGEEV